MTAPVLPLTTHITNQSNALSPKQRYITAQYGNGFKQIARDGFNTTVEKWEIYYHPMSGSELTTVLNFLDTIGCDVWFTWTPIGESTSKKWRVVPKTTKKTMFSFTKLQVSFTIEQAFDLGT